MEIFKEEFGTLAICAERYALGRKTYMPDLVCRIIKNYISQLDDRDIHVLINDIENPLFGDYGSNYDKETWMDLLKVLKEHKHDNN